MPELVRHYPSDLILVARRHQQLARQVNAAICDGKSVHLRRLHHLQLDLDTVRVHSRQQPVRDCLQISVHRRVVNDPRTRLDRIRHGFAQPHLLLRVEHVLRALDPTRQGSATLTPLSKRQSA